MKKINDKLESGWNPFIENEAPKSFYKLFEAAEVFMNVKKKELEYDSIRTYNTGINNLKKFIKNKDITIIEFDKKLALDYLNYIYIDCNSSEVTYNNTRNFGKLLFNWFIEHNYCNVNPFIGIRTKKVKQKKRIPITDDYRLKIKNYLEDKKEYGFLNFCFLVFYTLLRPKEIFMLKPDMFKLDRYLIILPANICKDDEDRFVTIPELMIPYLKMLDIENINIDNYVFSTGFMPGKLLKNSKYSGKRWDRLRKQLNIPKPMQNYSLKDTGIINMFDNNIDTKSIKEQAGHSSLKTTDKYSKFANLKANENIKDIGGF